MKNKNTHLLKLPNAAGMGVNAEVWEMMLVHTKEKQAVIYEVILVSVCSGKYDGQSFFLCFRHVIILV